jgi:peptidoglycan-associated lipoprotein
MPKWIIAVMLAALVVGCKSTETQNPAPIEEQQPGAAGAGGAGGAGGTSTSGVNTSGVGGTPGAGASGAANQYGLSPALRDPNNILSKRIVYFDYDSFVVKDDYRAVVEAHAKYLQANRNAKITLQGHTDERGSREYNIALGQKRADAVKKLMQLLGATEMQIETVSFGKEKPKTDGHDESSWAQNRRVEIFYVGE